MNSEAEHGECWGFCKWSIDAFREYYGAAAEKWSHTVRQNVVDDLRHTRDLFLVSHADHQFKCESGIALNVPDLRALVLRRSATA